MCRDVQRAKQSPDSVFRRIFGIALLLLAVLPATAQTTGGGLYNEVHCLCIGINDYKASGMATLLRAEDDAKAVADVFESTYGYRVNRLLGQGATKAAITNKLEWCKENLGTNDALIVFFAGHGQSVELPQAGSAGFLVPFNAALSKTPNASEWEAEAIAMTYLGDHVKEMKCRHVLILADTCYSGFLGRRSAVAGRVDLSELLKLKSRVAITAGTESQAALEQANLAHGYYTTALLEELKKPAPAGVSEIFTGLREKVARISNGRMLPQLREIVVENGEFVFIPKTVKRENLLSTATEIVQRLVRRRGGQMSTRDDVLDALVSVGYRKSADAPKGEKEWQMRFQRFTENASIGQPMAMAGLFYCYSKGLGTGTNLNEAGLWARGAFEGDLPEGKAALGIALLNGYGIDKNIEAGEKLLRASAAETPESAYELALYLASSGSEESRYSEAKRLLESASEKGFHLATITLARAWLGRVVSEEIDRFPASFWDKPRGRKLIDSLKDTSIPQAEFERYVLWSAEQPGFPPKDSAKALGFLRRAAEAGYAEAQMVLACENYSEPSSFDSMLGLKKNITEAKKWSELAAAQGSSEAAVLLATLLEEGSKVKANWATARKVLDEAAARNYPRALWLKGFFVREGRCGYAKDEEKGDSLRAEAALLRPKYALRLARFLFSWRDKFRWYVVAARQQDNLAAEDELFLFLMRSNRRLPSDDQTQAFRDFVNENRSWVEPLWDSGESWFKRAERAQSYPVFERYGVLRPDVDDVTGKEIYFYYDGPGAYAWEALEMAAGRGSTKASAILTRGGTEYYLEQSTNYHLGGLQKERLWAHVEALRASEGTLPRERFVSLVKEIPALFKKAGPWSEREVGRLFGRTRDAFKDEGNLKPQMEVKILRVERALAAKELQGLKPAAEDAVVGSYLIMASRPGDGAWPGAQKALRLYEALSE